MTDAELSKAVADACGIEVTVLWDGRVHRKNSDFYFRPTKDWNDAMLAAEKCGLFDKHDAAIEKNRATGGWVVSFYPDAKTKHIDAVNNQSGPRAICEAIIQIAKGKGCTDSGT